MPPNAGPPVRLSGRDMKSHEEVHLKQCTLNINVYVITSSSIVTTGIIGSCFHSEKKRVGMGKMHYVA